MTCQTEQPAKFSCSKALGEAIGAYHQLMVGQTRVRVKHGESEVEYDKRNLSALRQYIMSLHQSCPCAESAAMLGIPQNRRPGSPVYGNSRYTEAGCGCGPSSYSVQTPCRTC
jgi:hypothetical protein